MKSDFTIKLFSLIVLLCILLSGLLIKSILKKDSTTLLKSINSIQYSINNGKWNNARKLSNDLNTQWEKNEPTWALFINHHEIDNITISLKKSISYISNNDKINATAYLNELKEYVEHIPAMETISLKNVF